MLGTRSAWHGNLDRHHALCMCVCVCHIPFRCFVPTCQGRHRILGTACGSASQANDGIEQSDVQSFEESVWPEASGKAEALC